MTKTEKVNKIQEVVEESLGLIWVDKLVYDFKTKTYHTATYLDFSRGKTACLYLTDSKKKPYMAKVVVNNSKFNISVNGMKIDATEHWKELLSETVVVSSSK